MTTNMHKNIPCINRYILKLLFASCILWIQTEVCHGKAQYKVRCSPDIMSLELVRTENMGDIYLENMKNYPDSACWPIVEPNKVSLSLNLTDIYQCAVTLVRNKLTNRRTYYHRLVIEPAKHGDPKQLLLLKCSSSSSSSSNSNHTVHRRNVLPAGFQEPEDLEITTSVTGIAPEPMLNVAVRQGNQLVTGELNVNPGTPLQMEVNLDKSSAPVYGLLVSYMQVTDTKNQEETIIFNGCSVDPYLFENFNTVDGDILTAKFRAFKFPESTYVQFKGTVNVCLDKCRGVECSNGQVGFGRRRRDISDIPSDPNKVFEVTMTTFIKVDFSEDTLFEKGKLGGSVILPKQMKKNETQVTAAVSEDVGTNKLHEHDHHKHQHLKLAAEEIHENLEYMVILESKNSAATITSSFKMLLPVTILIYCFFTQ